MFGVGWFLEFGVFRVLRTTTPLVKTGHRRAKRSRFVLVASVKISTRLSPIWPYIRTRLRPFLFRLVFPRFWRPNFRDF